MPNAGFTRRDWLHQAGGGFGTLALNAWLQREIPLRRLEQPEEVAAAIAFLLSDDADYVTGEAVNVSGGQTLL